MAALGIGLVFAGYTVALLGILWITGKNVSPGQLFAAPWPPQVGPG